MKPITRSSALAAALMLALGLAAAPGRSTPKQTRSFRQAFPAGAEVRLANLAGRIEIVRGQGTEVVVDATVHADGDSAAETQRLLQGMKWVKSHDKKGREEWALSYPVEKYRSYTYPTRQAGRRPEPAGLPELPRTSATRPRPPTAASGCGSTPSKRPRRRRSTPTCGSPCRPAPTWPCATRSARCAAGDLEGTLSIDTGSGDVQIASHSGQLWPSTPARATWCSARPGARPRSTPARATWSCKRLVGNGSVDTGSGDVDGRRRSPPASWPSTRARAT